MPALNLPGLTSSSLPTPAAGSGSAFDVRDLAQTTAEVSVSEGVLNTADTPTASFGQHLRQARGKASAGARNLAIERESDAPGGADSARRAFGRPSSETASGRWPSTIQTASVAGARWTGRGEPAGALNQSPDPRAKSLLEAAQPKTAGKDAMTNSTPAATADRSGPASSLDLKSIASRLTGAEAEASQASPGQGHMALSAAKAEAIQDTMAAEVDRGTATSLTATAVATTTARADDPLKPQTSTQDTPADTHVCTDNRHALAANLIASAKVKTMDETSAISTAVVDAEPAEPAWVRDTAESEDDKPTQAATDGFTDPSVLQPQATTLTTPQPPPAASSAVLGPLESTAADTRATDVSASSTALLGASQITADASALPAANSAVLPSGISDKPAAASADAETLQARTETDGSAASAAVPSTTTHAAGAAAPAQLLPLETSTSAAAVAPVAQPTVLPDASVARGHELTSATPRASVTPVYDGTIDPAIDTAAFAPALGARIAFLARDGMERARLNVHPADMGPISVQLSLDGTQVRVDFSADMAGTRQTLEAAMPSLAASLRDAGFTLSGGGVSQQSAQGGRSSDGNATANNAGSGTRGNAAADDSVNASVNIAPNRGGREAGLVDLFA